VGGAGQDFWEDFERREPIYVLWTAIPNAKTSGWGRACMPSAQKNEIQTHQLRTKPNCVALRPRSIMKWRGELSRVKMNANKRRP
jgi:hypothetical protein